MIFPVLQFSFYVYYFSQTSNFTRFLVCKEKVIFLFFPRIGVLGEKWCEGTWQTKRADVVLYLFFPNKIKNIFTLDFTTLTISWKFHYIENILSFFLDLCFASF